MGAFRITQRLMIDRTLFNLGNQERKLLDLQEQLATGLSVNRPSDDPLAVRRALNGRTEISKTEQFLTNISTITPTLRETETSTLTTVNIIQRANELTLQGINDTNGQDQRDAIALEIDALLESLFNEGNHITDERYIFGGTRTTAAPFAATRNVDGEISAVAYEGNDQRIEIEVQEDVRAQINATGEEVFTSTSPTSVNLFDTLIGIRDELRAGNTGALDARLAELDRGQSQVLVATARVGAIENRIERIQASHEQLIVQFQTVVSDNIDADFGEVIVELNAQSNAFQASLDAAARVIQPSLLTFLS
ncbi:MAG: flagellar hook-associated protein FlgL [Candidatus Hydrogenedentes bacterium]|nr:flagellar hook-associated protein FlgL [Candidatus Hydrogenedentota bacterium]